MNRRTVRLWDNLEHFLEFKFPAELKAILNISGFDCELSLKEIDEKSIELIEERVNTNLVANDLETVSALKGSTYEQKPLPFRFLLGHKILILSIPEKINSLKKNKTKKRLGKRLLGQIENDSEEKVYGPEEYKNALLLKLKNYADKYKLNFEIKENNIKKFTQVNKVIRCVVQCCFCETKIPCTFHTFWIISNLTAHIRGHLGIATGTVNITTAESSSNQDLSTQSIVRHRSGVLKEIENIV